MKLLKRREIRIKRHHDNQVWKKQHGKKSTKQSASTTGETPKKKVVKGSLLWKILEAYKKWALRRAPDVRRD